MKTVISFYSRLIGFLKADSCRANTVLHLCGYMSRAEISLRIDAEKLRRWHEAIVRPTPENKEVGAEIESVVKLLIHDIGTEIRDNSDAQDLVCEWFEFTCSDNTILVCTHTEKDGTLKGTSVVTKHGGTFCLQETGEAAVMWGHPDVQLCTPSAAMST